jgi:hypothetical protein
MKIFTETAFCCGDPGYRTVLRKQFGAAPASESGAYFIGQEYSNTAASKFTRYHFDVFNKDVSRRLFAARRIFRLAAEHESGADVGGHLRSERQALNGFCALGKPATSARSGSRWTLKCCRRAGFTSS